MNRRQALVQVRKILKDHNIDDSFLEGEILLRHAIGVDRAELFSGPDKELTSIQVKNLMQYVERRCSGEPSAYITGHREFYQLDFKVDPRVLIPRPETELLVEKAINLFKKYDYSSIADIGTGCGCIAISLAMNFPDAIIYAVDISLPALEIAEDNCSKHGLTGHIIFLSGDLLKPLSKQVDIIVANLPYVKTADINTFEPEQALNGGEDGLDIIKAIIPQISARLKPNGTLLLEIGLGQADAVKFNLQKAFPQADIESFKDLAGIERVVSMRLTA